MRVAHRAGRILGIAAAVVAMLAMTSSPATAASVATPAGASTGDSASTSSPVLISPTTTPAERRSAERLSRQRQRLEEQTRRKAQRKTQRIEQRKLERQARATARNDQARAAAVATTIPPDALSPIRPRVAGVTITTSPGSPTPGTETSTPLSPIPGGATKETSGRTRQPSPSELQELLNRWTASRPDLGAISVTVRQDSQSWTGSARNGGPAPNPLERYRSLSITKTITAALVLRQVEFGTLSLDGPLPALSGISAPLPGGLTIRHLLRHRSGLIDYNVAPGYTATAPLNARQAVELTLRAGLRQPVGSTTAYTNSNYLYLGLLLEQVTGRPYADLVNDLTSSIGMSNTSVEPPDRPGWPAFSSGGVMSTTADLALWGEALTTPDRVLQPSSLGQMLSFDASNSGLGMWTYCPCSPAGGATIGHHTATGGLFIVPFDRLVIVMRADVDNGDTAGRARSLIDAIISLRAATEAKARNIE